MNTNFQGQKVPKENAAFKCISLIMLDSVIRVNKKYYPQTLLEECRYVIRKNKMENLINNDLTLSSSDESANKSDEGDNESDNEFDNESVNESLNESNKNFLIMMNLVINFKRIKLCFNNNKRLSCMVYLVIHKAVIIFLNHHFVLLKLIKERKKSIYL